MKKVQTFHKMIGVPKAPFKIKGYHSDSFDLKLEKAQVCPKIGSHTYKFPLTAADEKYKLGWV